MQGRPVRHHTVPRFYLAGFADGKRLRAVELASDKVFDTNVSDATAENHFYSLPDHPSNKSAFENHLAHVESQAAGLLGSIIAGGVWPLNREDRQLLADFMALQFLRGQDHRAQLDHLLATVLRRLADEDPVEFERIKDLPGAPVGLDAATRGFPPLMTSTAHVAHIETLRPRLISYFLERAWTAVHFRSAALLTSDAPITPIPQLGGDRSLGLGLNNAQAMVFPLARHVGLIMQSLDSLGPLPDLLDIAEEDPRAGRYDLMIQGDETFKQMFNNNTVMHAHRRVYHHPDDGSLVPANARSLSALGGRINFENPPDGLDLAHYL